jgi:hypothetical protein
MALPPTSPLVKRVTSWLTLYLPMTIGPLAAGTTPPPTFHQ